MTNAMSSLDVGVKPRPLGRYSSLGRTACARSLKSGCADMSSSIRTLTVGPGLSPSLLTFHVHGSARGLPDRSGYRRWGISPGPENTRN